MPLSFDNEQVKRFINIIDMAQKITIVSHLNPDGDAVGSLLGCKHWLNNTFFKDRHDVVVNTVLPGPSPHDATYLPGSEAIVDAANDYELCTAALADADVIICVDFSNKNRIEPLSEALYDSKACKIAFDHHHNPDTALFDMLYSVPDLSSTCELLYWFFAQTRGDSSVTDAVAQCLYHGINTDTGCFSYANEDASLYEATAALMKHPLHAEDVHNRLFNGYSFNKMRILSHLLYNKLKIFPEERFAYIAISADELASLGGKTEDLEGLVNYTLMMEQIQVGALVKEDKRAVRISFRAKTDFDVNVFARNYFGGGGHIKASGATSPYPFDETVQKLEEFMLKELRERS